MGEIDVGQTDSNGNLKVVCAATTETPGGKGGGEDSDGVTDSNGNLMCKAYA